MANAGQGDGEVGIGRITCHLDNKCMPDKEVAVCELAAFRLPLGGLDVASAPRSFCEAQDFLDSFWLGFSENTEGSFFRAVSRPTIPSTIPHFCAGLSGSAVARWTKARVEFFLLTS